MASAAAPDTPLCRACCWAASGECASTADQWRSSKPQRGMQPRGMPSRQPALLGQQGLALRFKVAEARCKVLAWRIPGRAACWDALRSWIRIMVVVLPAQAGQRHHCSPAEALWMPPAPRGPGPHAGATYLRKALWGLAHTPGAHLGVMAGQLQKAGSLDVALQRGALRHKS